MGFINFFKNLLPKKKERGLIIETQPQLPIIDPRKPLVILEEDRDDIEVDMKTWKEKEEKVTKSCSVCKFGIHDVSLGDLESIICTLNPNKPCIVLLTKTCDKHESKYDNLKVIVDKGTLLEYDSEKTFVTERPLTEKDVTEIGEDEWQQ